VKVNIVDGSLSDGDNSSVVTFKFSEAPVGFTASDVVATGGTLSGLTLDLAGDPSGKTYTATFTADDGFTGTGKVSVTSGSYTDVALNVGSGGSDTVAVDTKNPTVKVNIVDGSLSDGDDSSVVTFKFSEAPVGFTASDVVATGGTLSGLTQDAGRRSVGQDLHGNVYGDRRVQRDRDGVGGSGSYTDAGSEPGRRRQRHRRGRSTP
jgi:hypothetical protein